MNHFARTLPLLLTLVACSNVSRADEALEIIKDSDATAVHCDLPEGIWRSRFGTYALDLEGAKRNAEGSLELSFALIFGRCARAEDGTVSFVPESPFASTSF